MKKTSFRKTLVASSIAFVLCTSAAEATLVSDIYGPYTFTTDSANFTMLDPLGGVVGGTNDVSMIWNGDGFNASSDYTGPGSVSNVTASSTTPFFGYNWTAHDIQVFTPGTYSFDATLGGGVAESGFVTGTVGAGQLGIHMLFDWNGGLNIDVFVIADPNAIFGSGLLLSTVLTGAGVKKCESSFTGTTTKNCLYDGAAYGSAGEPTKNQVWMLASVDGNGDGIMGIPMAAGGPFAGFNANFNANLTAPSLAVPLPAATWLLGSGIMGLVVAGRRRKIT